MCRWGFWRRLGTKKEKALLPEGQVPSSPASQHTLTIQEPGKGVESSSPSKRFNSGFSSVFASPLAQQQQLQQQQGQQGQHRLNVSRVNSAMSRKPSAAVAVGRRSTDMGGAAGSVAARAAGPVAGSAAAVTSDPLLQAGLLEAVNLGKQVSGCARVTKSGIFSVWFLQIAFRLPLQMLEQQHRLAQYSEHWHMHDILVLSCRLTPPPSSLQSGSGCAPALPSRPSLHS